MTGAPEERPRAPGAARNPDGDQVAELRAALRARDEFLSVAAHELRNPLTPITMQVAMLLRAARAADPPLPAGIVAMIERLELATRRFLKRATVLLDVSRLAAGHPFRPEVARFDLSALVLEVVADHAPLAERVRSPLDVSAVAPGVAGAWDRVGVELVLDNLLSNALKHGAGAPVAVGLEWIRPAAPGAGQGLEPERVRLWVADRGRGLPPEDQERIFRRFEQARTRAATAGGFGVGLWVAREVARAMGGDVVVASEPGAGAVFSLVLPRDVAAHLEAGTTEGGTPP